jgi:hypothetical protein
MVPTKSDYVYVQLEVYGTSKLIQVTYTIKDLEGMKDKTSELNEYILDSHIS